MMRNSHFKEYSRLEVVDMFSLIKHRNDQKNGNNLCLLMTNEDVDGSRLGSQ